MQAEEFGRRIRQAKADWEESTGQGELSLRALERQMREAGYPVARQTLATALGGERVPDRETEQRLCSFFGVPMLAPTGGVMARMGELTPEHVREVESLVDRLLAEQDEATGET